MRIHSAKWFWLALLLLVATATPAQAGDPVVLQLQAPTEVRLGEEVRITAILKDSRGNPLPGASIILWRPASFLSTGGTIQLGRVTTDAQGRAIFRYEARDEGKVTLNAYFPGDSKYEAAQGSTEITVQGSVQLYQETAGVQVPGVGVWLLVVVLGGVWSVYFAVMVLLTLIAREAPRALSGIGDRYG